MGELVVAEPALAQLATLSLPVKQAYGIAKLLRLVRQEIEHFQAQRHACIQALGVERDPTPDERGRFGDQKLLSVTAENQEAFTARMQELQALEVTLDLGPIDLEAFGAAQTFTAADLVLLGPLVKEPSE